MELRWKKKERNKERSYYNCNYQEKTKGAKEDNWDWRIEKYERQNESTRRKEWIEKS